MGLASFSLASCFDEVPVEIRAWKPEQAPQATVMKSAGNIGPIFVLQPVNIGMEKLVVPVRAETKMPMTAMPIIA